MRMILLFAGAALAALSLSSENSAACRVNDTECNRATDGNVWSGTDKKPNQLLVTVCHGYWDRLDVGDYRGVRTRWWEPVIVKGNWKSTPLPTITQRCKKMWRRYGEQVAVFASCVNRIIWTPPITTSGKTYTLY